MASGISSLVNKSDSKFTSCKINVILSVPFITLQRIQGVGRYKYIMRLNVVHVVSSHRKTPDDPRRKRKELSIE